MNSERWSRIRELFDATLSLPPAERGRMASRGLRRGRRAARRSGEFARPRQSSGPRRIPRRSRIENPEPGFTGDWPPRNGRHPTAMATRAVRARAQSLADTDCFSPKAAIASTQWHESDDETRSVDPVAAA